MFHTAINANYRRLFMTHPHFNLMKPLIPEY